MASLFKDGVIEALRDIQQFKWSTNRICFVYSPNFLTYRPFSMILPFFIEGKAPRSQKGCKYLPFIELGKEVDQMP